MRIVNEYYIYNVYIRVYTVSELYKLIVICDIPTLSNQQYEECLGRKISVKTAHEIISIAASKFLNEFLRGNVNEYKNFIKYENIYSELKEIDADGEDSIGG